MAPSPLPLIIIIGLVCLGTAFVGYVLYVMARKQAMSRLKANERISYGFKPKNEYEQVIFKAKIKLEDNLQKYGLRRGVDENQRNFNKRVEAFVPETEKYLEEVRGLVQEVLFSAHKLGEPERDRCIMALRNVQFRLEKKIPTEEELKVIYEGRTRPYEPIRPETKKRIEEAAFKGFYRETLNKVTMEKLYEDGVKAVPENELEKENPVHIHQDVKDYFLNILASFAAKGLLASAPRPVQIGEFVVKVKEGARKAARDHLVPEDVKDALEAGRDGPFQLNKALKELQDITMKDIIAYAHTDVVVPG